MNDSQKWETPDELFQKCDRIWGFELDVCADEVNYKVKRYFDEEEDGLKQDWKHFVCWCNPPYQDPKPWILKAQLASMAGALIVMLLPVDTSTVWFEEVYESCDEIIFLRPRVRFVGSPGSPRWANMLVVWRPDVAGLIKGRPAVYHWNWKEGEVSDNEAEEL